MTAIFVKKLKSNVDPNILFYFVAPNKFLNSSNKKISQRFFLRQHFFSHDVLIKNNFFCSFA